jgi:hypothetical protein
VLLKLPGLLWSAINPFDAHAAAFWSEYSW